MSCASTGRRRPAAALWASFLGACPMSATPFAQEAPADYPRVAAAAQAYDAGDKDRAVEMLRAFCREQPDDGVRPLRCAELLIQRRQDAARGEEFSRRGLERMPELPQAWLLHGAALLFNQKADEAEALFRDATARFPQDVDLLFSLGMACVMNQKNLEAQQHLRAALQRKPDQPLFLFTLGENCVRLHRLDEAEVLLRRAAELRPPHPDALGRLADVLALRGRPGEAEACFRRALETGPAGARLKAALQYAIFLVDQRRSEEALPHLVRVTEKKADDRVAWHYLARCLQKLGRKEEAAVAVARYRDLQQRVDRAEDTFLLGLIAEQLRVGKKEDGAADGGAR